MRFHTVNEVVEACFDHLKSNELKGQRWGLNYHFYQPSQTGYGPFQWLWDSGWHQLVWSHRNVENSLADLRSMLQFQQSNGFIPQMIYWGKKQLRDRIMDKLAGYSKKKWLDSTTGKQHKGVFWNDISQMPMLAYSLRAIWNKTQDLEILKEFLPKLVHYQKWWHNERDPDKDGLISIIHPWESGLDASPIYDPVFGVSKYPVKTFPYYKNFINILFNYKWKAKWNLPEILRRGWFNVEDIGVCCCYADAWRVLSKLADNINPELSQECKKFNQFYSQKIVEKAWDTEHQQFISFYHVKGKEYPSYHETVQSLFPLLLDDLPSKIHDILIKKIQDPEKFGLPYPIPSTAKSDSAFDSEKSNLLWRGPSWGNTNWMVMEGLLKHNDTEVANHILDRWLEMSQKYGIAEYHNPITGEMQGEEGLGMATTIVDMLYRLKRV